VDCIHNRVEDVFETDQLSDGLVDGGRHHLMRRTIGNDVSSVEHERSFSQSENFLTAVCDVEDRDAVGLIPLAKVGNYFRFRRRIERSQRFVEQEYFGIRNQGSRQGDTLAFSARDLAHAAG
jgi:hypothetical protein